LWQWKVLPIIKIYNLISVNSLLSPVDFLLLKYSKVFNDDDDKLVEETKTEKEL